MSKYVTAETVSPGHPDKIADLISDYVLTKALQNNSSSRVAVETFLTGTKNGGLVLVGGEISEIASKSSKLVLIVIFNASFTISITSLVDIDAISLISPPTRTKPPFFVPVRKVSTATLDEVLFSRAFVKT